METIHGIYITQPHKEKARKIAEKLSEVGIKAFIVLSGRDTIIAVRPDDAGRAENIRDQVIMSD